MPKNQVRDERFIYTATLWSFIEGSEDRSSKRAESWRQELMMQRGHEGCCLLAHSSRLL